MKNKTKEVSHLSVCRIIVGLWDCVESITVQQERKHILKALSHWTHTYFSDSSILNASVHTEIRITRTYGIYFFEPILIFSMF